LGSNTAQSFAGNYDAFRQGMRDLGYVEGKDFVTEFRYAGGEYDRLPALAAELAASKVDILLVSTGIGTRAMQQASTTIPIVLVGIIDPVGNGYVASLARPGGNITGLAGAYDDSAPKQLELLAAILSNPSRIGFLGNPETTGYAAIRQNAECAANTARISLVVLEVRKVGEIEMAFARFVEQRVQGVMVMSDGLVFAQRAMIAQSLLRHRLPAMFQLREYVEAGGLMSYGESQSEFYRRAATYVHKLMRGAKPADLPVELPTRFHLVINRKTADVLGLTIPALLYIFADEVIE
jgi:putative tryptophan/tyrosine transport system substrate-binding protein